MKDDKESSEKLIRDVVIWSGRTDLPSGAAYTFVRCARKLEELETLEANTILYKNLVKRCESLEKQLEAVRSVLVNESWSDGLDDCRLVCVGDIEAALSND